MAKTMGVSEVDEFLNGPLFTWFKNNCDESFTEGKPTYEDLVDGVLIHDVFRQMDYHIQEKDICSSENNVTVRTRNLKKILVNLQFFYEELGYIILRLPDVVRLANEPRLHVQEAELLLCLLLGCAIQCPNKEHFINKIKNEVDESIHFAIAKYIHQVQNVPGILLSMDMLKCKEPDVPIPDQPNLNENLKNVQKAFEQVRKIVHEHKLYRDKLHNVVRATRNDQLSISCQDVSVIVDEDELNSILHCSIRSDYDEDTQQREKELLEWKSKVKVQGKELKEKEHYLQECKDELQECKHELTKLKKNNEKLASDARDAKSYRDELDAANEKIERVDRLEQEINRYKEKMKNLDFCKSRINELSEHNRLLVEDKKVLLEQVNSNKVKVDKLLDLEEKILKLQKQLEDLAMENEDIQHKYQEVCEEKSQLERLVKENTKDILNKGFVLESEDFFSSMDNKLSEQLTNSAQSTTLKLELENRRLSTLVDSLKENSFYENSSKIHDLEKDKKKLSLKADTLSEDLKKLSRRNNELESNYKKAFEEFNSLSLKYDNLESKHNTLMREKMRLQTLLESKQKQSIDFQRSSSDMDQKIKEPKVMKDAVNETMIKQKDLESRVISLEAEKANALNEVEIQRELVKEKIIALDEATKMIQNLEKKLKMVQTDESSIEMSKLKNIMELIENNSYNTIKFNNKSSNRININEDKVSNLAKEENKDKEKLQSLIESLDSENYKSILKLVNNQLIAENEILQKPRDKVISNQELNSNYQTALQERNLLKSQLRDAKIKVRFQHQSIENLESTCKYLEEECNNLRTNKLEHTELKEDFTKLYQAHTSLMKEYHKIKFELTNITSNYANYEEKINDKNQKIIDLEQQISKFNNRIEVLIQINESLDNDKRKLMDNVSHLLEQNHELIKQSLEDKEHYHMEERKNNDKVISLNRQKEKLEEKIMDHYRKLESCPARKKNSGTSIVRSTFVKVRRAGSELFNRSRRSWAEDTSPTTDRTFDFEYTKGEGSDLNLNLTFTDEQVCELSHGARSRKSVD